MEEVRYKTNRKWAIIIAVPLLLIIIISVIGIDRPMEPLATLVFLLFLFVSIDVFWGMFVMIKNSKIYTVKSFIFRKSLNIHSITNIYYSQTFNLGKSFANRYRSLYIIAHLPLGRKIIRLPNNSYTEKVLTQIAKKLKELNPRIELDENIKYLIESMKD